MMLAPRQSDLHPARRLGATAALVACLAVAVACDWAEPGSSAPKRASLPRLFASGSVWNRGLAPNAHLDPSSPRLVAGLVQEVGREQAARTGPWIQTSDHSTPLYVAGPNQARTRVALDDPGAPWRQGLQQALSRVPIPAKARPAAGNDGHLTVWQPSTDTLWELWRARRQPDGWHASWGGAIKRVSRSLGYYTEHSWPGLSSHHWGATATSLPVIGGTMLVRELRSGSIPHALALALPAPAAGRYSWPAQRTDGHGPPSAIPEGARLRLPAKLDLEALKLPRMTLMMAKAAKRYGIIVRDQTGTAIGFFAQDPAGFSRDPYYGSNGLFAGRHPNQLLARFPWGQLKVLKMSLCSDQSLPCLRR